MPMVEKANTQISAKPKREPATAANTSSLISTKPPTAVMMPSVISISPPMRPFHPEELLRDGGGRARIVALERCERLCGQRLQLGRIRTPRRRFQLFACLPLHFARVSLRHAMLRLKPDDFRSFRCQRAQDAGVGQRIGLRHRG